MSVRARWGLEDTYVDDDGDPFEAATPVAAEPAPADPVVDGVPIDLHGSAPELNLRIVELVGEEKRLWDLGVRCSLKDQHDMTCHACPIGRGAPAFPLSQLCKVGVDQERTAAALIVERHARPVLDG